MFSRSGATLAEGVAEAVAVNPADGETEGEALAAGDFDGVGLVGAGFTEPAGLGGDVGLGMATLGVGDGVGG